MSENYNTYTQIEKKKIAAHTCNARLGIFFEFSLILGRKIHNLILP